MARSGIRQNGDGIGKLRSRAGPQFRRQRDDLDIVLQRAHRGVIENFESKRGSAALVGIDDQMSTPPKIAISSGMLARPCPPSSAAS